MYIMTYIYNKYICTYITKKNKMYSILFGLSILYEFLPILMDFSFSFFPSSYLGLLLLGFLGFPISFFFLKIFDLVFLFGSFFYCWGYFCLDRLFSF